MELWSGDLDVNPAAVNIALPKTTAMIEAGIDRGLHLGAQLYLCHQGRQVEIVLGQDRPGTALSRDALMAWMSSCKPITAVALAQLWEEGKLDLDDPVRHVIPEFAVGGKEAITLRHLLTHTGGFRMVSVGWPRVPWEETIARICASRKEPNWRPGYQAGYHMASSWFILGEVVQRLASQPFAQVVRERIFEPLGMVSSWIGMEPEQYRQLRPRLATTWNTTKVARETVDGETVDGKLVEFGWESKAHCLRPSPAGGGRGPMHDLGRFYRALLAGGELNGRRILTPQTVEALTARHRVGLRDKTFKAVMDWSLGFIPDSRHYGAAVPYSYGSRCSSRTFGHSGYRSSTGFADPEHQLVVALAFNGLPSDADHDARMRSTLDALYEDLGLVADLV